MGVLRLLLALSVIASHCGNILNTGFVGGAVAVQSFYIISGFYMSLILNEKYTGPNRSYRLFLSNRLLRLLPLYWMVLLIMLAGCCTVYVLSNHQLFPVLGNYRQIHFTPATLLFLLFVNLSAIGQDIVMFLGIDPSAGTLYFTNNFWSSTPPLFSFLLIPQAWSLSLEIWFYLAAPILLRRKPILIAIVLFLSFSLRYYLYNHFDLQHDPWTYRYFPTELLFFLLGYFSYRLYKLIKPYNLPHYLPITILLLIISCTCCYDNLPPIHITSFPFSLNDSSYFILITLSIPILFKHYSNKPVDIYLGELSYPVYISHLMVATFLQYIPFKWLHQSISIAFVSILLSWQLNKWITQPLEKFRQRRLLPSVKTIQ